VYVCVYVFCAHADVGSVCMSCTELTMESRATLWVYGAITQRIKSLEPFESM